MCKRFLLCTCVLFSVFLVVLSMPGRSHALSQGQDNLVCILDASGSMWGKVGGRAKIEIAKETLNALIESLPDSMAVGLVAYGHRSKGDCNDVEVLVPLGAVDKKLLVGKIGKLSPKGKTPLTESVRRTAESLRTVEGKTTILLVSDGKETCDGDPCALVRELKASGVDFVLDVIGFDVTEEEREQLECMAEAGGGTYYNVSNADQFQKAIDDTAKERELAAGKLQLRTTRNGKEIRAHVAVLDPETGEKITHAWTYLELGFTRLLKPGNYILEVTDDKAANKPSQRIDVTIEGGKTLEQTVDFSSGVVNLATVLNGKPFEAFIKVFPTGGEKTILNTFSDNKQHVAKLVLPPGKYTVRVKSSKTKDNAEKVIENLEVVAGKEDSLTVAFESGTLDVRAMLEGKEAKAQVKVLGQEKGNLLWFEKCASGKAASFPLSPGKYALLVNALDTKQRMEPVKVPEVVVKAGETTHIDVELLPGEVKE